jgi:hypothetical protein
MFFQFQGENAIKMRYAQAFSFDFGLRRNSLAAWGHQHFLRNADKASLATHPLHFLSHFLLIYKKIYSIFAAA